MASSHYQGFVGVTTSAWNKFRTDVPLSEYKQVPSLHVANDPVPSGHTGTYLINCNNDHTCRETVLNRINEAVRKYNGANNYTPQVAYLRYHKEAYSPLSATKLEMIREFGERVIDDDYAIVVGEDSVTLGIQIKSISEALSRMLSTASWLMWIFRNDEILDYSVKYAQKRQGLSIKDFMLHMAHQFPLHENWGNDSNENIALSLFAFMVGSGHDPRFPELHFNGPNNFALCNIEANTILRYTKKVLIPILVKKGATLTSTTGLEQNFPVHSALGTDLTYTLESILYREWVRTQ